VRKRTTLWRGRWTRRIEFGCRFCADDQNRLFGHVTQIGSDESRRRILLQCPRCGALYENTPRGNDNTHRLTMDQANKLYPDVTINGSARR